MHEAGNFESNEKNQIITDLNRSCQAFFELCSIDAFQITASAFCAAAFGVTVKAKIAYLKAFADIMITQCRKVIGEASESFKIEINVLTL